MKLTKVISGGQTGADMGGLLAARNLGIPTGGVAPLDWHTEDGPQPKLLLSFGLFQCSNPGYLARTRANVQLSDGTIIFGDMKGGGSLFTLNQCTELEKPWIPMHLVPFIPTHQYDFLDWLVAHDIQTLNVAGNRESKNPGIQEKVRKFLETTLPQYKD